MNIPERHFEAVTYSAKAAISAVLGVVGYEWLHLPGSQWVAGVSAVIVTQPTLHSSLKASSLRVTANIGGALVGAMLAFALGKPLLAMAVGIMLTGLVCYALRQDDALRVDRVHELLLGRAHRPDILYVFAVPELGIGIMRRPALVLVIWTAREKRMHIFLSVGRVTRLRTHGALGHEYSRVVL